MKITKINKEDLNKEVKEQALPVEEKKKKQEEQEELVKILTGLADEQEGCDCDYEYGDFPVVDIDLDDVDGSPIDTKLFRQGIKDVSRLAGQFSALRSVGMSEQAIIEVILNTQVIDFNEKALDKNLKIAEIQKESNEI